MNIFSGYLVGTLAFSSIFLSSDVQSDELSCKNKTVIYYGNGVLSNEKDRKKSLYYIRDLLKYDLAISSKEFVTFEFKNVHNETNGVIRDLGESTKQDFQTDFSRFYRILSGLEFMPDRFQQEALNLEIRIEKTALLNNQDLKKHVDQYEKDIRAGKNVIVVSHSQGNFFANQAYDAINNNLKNRFRIVSVANPDSIVGGDGAYTTLFEDSVINGIRLLKLASGLQLPKLPNESNIGTGLVDRLGHSFINAYMLPRYRSSNEIVTNIIKAIDSFPEANCPEIHINHNQTYCRIKRLFYSPRLGATYDFTLYISGFITSSIPLSYLPSRGNGYLCPNWSTITHDNGSMFCLRAEGDPETASFSYTHRLSNVKRYQFLEFLENGFPVSVYGPYENNIISLGNSKLLASEKTEPLNCEITGRFRPFPY
ncbi:MAG: hypothetical protein K0U54_05790 [Bacteroidetes bacterium]|nr:hypothetical protein [Bacteroidota bacterium]